MNNLTKFFLVVIAVLIVSLGLSVGGLSWYYNKQIDNLEEDLLKFKETRLQELQDENQVFKNQIEEIEKENEEFKNFIDTVSHRSTIDSLLSRYYGFKSK